MTLIGLLVPKIIENVKRGGQRNVQPFSSALKLGYKYNTGSSIKIILAITNKKCAKLL